MELLDRGMTERHAQLARHPSPSGGVAASPMAPARSSDMELSRAILESAPVSLIVVSPSGHIVGGNSATVALFGTERLDGHLLASFVEAEDRARAVEFIAQVCSGQTGTLRYWLVDANGQRRAVETRGVPVGQNDGSALMLGAIWEAASPAAGLEPPGILAAVVEAARGVLGTAHYALTGRGAPYTPTGEPHAAAIERERLKRRVADLEDSATDHTAQQTQLEARLAELARAADAHATERHQLQAQIAALQAAADTQASDRSGVQGRMAELVTAVSAAATERQRLERRIADLEGGATDHAAQRTQLEARLAELARAADAHVTERNQLQAQMAALQAAAKMQASDRERQERRIADLEDIATDHAVQRTQLEARVAELARTADTHATDRNQLQAEIADLQAAAETQASDRNRLQGRVAELVTAVSAAATERQRLERRIADFEGSATDHTAQRTQLEARLAELACAADEHARERNDLRTRVAALKLDVDDRRKECERLAARITELEAVPPADRDPARSHQAAGTSDEIQSLERQIADFRKELERYGLDLEAQVVRADRVEADLNSIRPAWTKPKPNSNPSNASSSWLRKPSESGQAEHNEFASDFTPSSSPR